MGSRSPRPPAPQPRRGEQTGKREAEERNDPEVQPGARQGNPDSRRRQQQPRQPHDLN